MTIKDRLLEYSKIKNMNVSKFCQYCSLSNGFFTRNGGITTEILAGILDKCVDLNPDWLLTGNGEMLRANQPDSPQQSNPMHVDIEAIKLLIEEKDRSIAALTTQIADLRIQLKIKDEQLAAKDAQLAAKDRMMCKLMGIEE